MIDRLVSLYRLDERLREAGEKALASTKALHYAAQDELKLRMLEIFIAAGIDEHDVVGSSGYGYDDAARAAYEHLLCAVFGTQSALGRLSLVSGTHAIVTALAGVTPHDRAILSISGAPYDTLRNAITSAPYSLREQGIAYREVPLIDGAHFDLDTILAELQDERIATVFVQRSRGYAPRKSLPVQTCAPVFEQIKRARPDVTIAVDNCYGELVERSEPTHVGADLVMGSLIKNLGGSLAPAGGYIAGPHALIERIAARLYAPGLGAALGPTLGFGRAFIHGLFLAPLVVEQALRSLDFSAALFAELGYNVDPQPGSARTDIVQAIRLGSGEKIQAFAHGLQRAMPLNARFLPEPGSVPGYQENIVMSSGAFVSGATIELSCDAPLRAPFEVYLQGGIIAEHGTLGALFAADAVLAAG